ncbi:MAG: putative AAA+ superfamily ATPase [Neolewinella sp.]|jgi:predicted AAA+ superfamily ATPase
MDFTPLRQLSDLLIDRAPETIVRGYINILRQKSRFVGLRGSRGVGKSTLLLQYAKERRDELGSSLLYVSLDELYFKKNKLVDFGREFVRQGGKLLLLDEVHRYGEDWSVELKLLYDSLPDLEVRFTSSSIIELSQAKGDLSRRAPLFDVYGLSFREFIQWSGGKKLPVYSLAEIIAKPGEIARELLRDGFKPMEYLKPYYRHGYYPYYWENPELYRQTVNTVVNTLLEQDLRPVYNLSVTTTERLKKMLVAIAESVPYKPNMSKLAEFLGTNRATVQEYFYYLHQAQLIGLLPRQVRGIIRTQKPEKVYLDNTNLLYALPVSEPSVGTLRETFFYNALTTSGVDLGYAKSGDFMTDDYVFEVGGRNKTNKQIAGQANAYRVLDDIDVGFGNRIPLWLFGLLR